MFDQFVFEGLIVVESLYVLFFEGECLVQQCVQFDGELCVGVFFDGFYVGVVVGDEEQLGNVVYIEVFDYFRVFV